MATSNHLRLERRYANMGPLIQYGDSTYEDGIDFGEDNSPRNDDGDDLVPNTKPMSKRRRVTRACDECRRKKIRCEGKQPCSHCAVFGYEWYILHRVLGNRTYDLPTNRRRNASPQYTEFLESQLKAANQLLQVIFPAMDFNTPGMLDHLRNRLQAQQSRQEPQPSTAPSTLSTAFPQRNSSEVISVVQQGTPGEPNGLLDTNEEGIWNVRNQLTDLNLMSKLWSCGEIPTSCANITSSPSSPPLLPFKFSPEFQSSYSPTGSADFYSPPTNRRGSLNLPPTSITSSPADSVIDATHNLHQRFMFPSASIGVSSAGSSVSNTQPTEASTMTFPFTTGLTPAEKSMAMFGNGRTQTNGQESEMQYLRSLSRESPATNKSYPAASAPGQLYNGHARQSSEYEEQFRENMHKTQLRESAVQRRVLLDPNDPTQPMHMVSPALNSSMHQHAWSHALLESRRTMNNTGIVSRSR